MEEDAEDALLDALCLAKCEELICVDSWRQDASSFRRYVLCTKLDVCCYHSPNHVGMWGRNGVGLNTTWARKPMILIRS